MTENQDKLDDVDEKLVPLAVAIGRAVLGAAALEKVLLVDIARRRGGREGLTERLGEDLARLERQPAGSLLKTLLDLGIPEDLATRIGDVVQRRNHLVHRFMEDPEVMRVFLMGEGVDRIVKRVDELVLDCQRLINDIAPIAFAESEAILGADLLDILEWAKSVDLDEIEDPGLRDQLRLARDVTAEQLSSFRDPPR